MKQHVNRKQVASSLMCVMAQERAFFLACEFSPHSLEIMANQIPMRIGNEASRRLYYIPAFAPSMSTDRRL